MQLESKSSSSPSQGSATWPYASLLFFGYFGATAPEAAKRWQRQAILAFTALMASCLAIPLLHANFPDAKRIAAVAAGISFAWAMWVLRKYVSELDELSQRIQLEAVAFAYTVGLALAIGVGILSVLQGFSVSLLWVVLAEPLRGIGLVLAARKYR